MNELMKNTNSPIFTGASHKKAAVASPLSDLEYFVENLISEKHGTSVPKPTHTKHRADLLDELHATLHKKLIERLHRIEAREADQLLHRGRPHHEIQRFILEKIPDASVYLTHVLLHFRIAYMAKRHSR